MKKRVYISVLLIIACLATTLVPLAAAFGEPGENPEFISWDQADYELSVLPGAYDSSLVLSVTSSITDNKYINPGVFDEYFTNGVKEPENDLIKGILISGNINDRYLSAGADVNTQNNKYIKATPKTTQKKTLFLVFFCSSCPIFFILLNTQKPNMARTIPEKPKNT